MADTTQVNVRVPNDHLEQLKALAQEDRRSLSDMLRFAVEHYLQERGK